eukprot:TRINITY_DN64829_c0_g1_i1.p2 TRINITY_DN64829_c0_g1~~TRINITY_DN64829_c0_g1_i1.p2  ORF type:complete len:282 (+),score=91.70 TRINITY_DN64829_c0_g1_i1:90-848(+)
MARAGPALTLMRGVGFAAREIAHRIDKFGCTMQSKGVHSERVNPLQPLSRYCGKDPTVDASCFVAPNATVLGQAFLGPHVAVFYHAAVKADIQECHIGPDTVIMERSVVRCANNFKTEIGSHCLIDPGCTLTGVRIGDHCYIGAGATLLEGSQVGSESFIAPGSVLRRFAVVPSGELWAGCPAEKVRDLTPEERQNVREAVHQAGSIAAEHKAMAEDATAGFDEYEAVSKEWATLCGDPPPSAAGQQIPLRL